MVKFNQNFKKSQRKRPGVHKRVAGICKDSNETIRFSLDDCIYHAEWIIPLPWLRE